MRTMKSFPATAEPALLGAGLAPVAALLGAMLSVTYGATLAKGLFASVGAAGTTSLRLCAGALILGLLMRPWRARLSLRILPSLLGYGVALGVMNLCFYMAIRTLPLGIAIAIEFTGPLLTAVLASRRRLDFLWVGLAAAGIALLSPALPAAHRLDPVGVLFALAAGLCWAVYILLGKRAGRAIGGSTAAIGTLIAAIVILPVGLLHAGAALFAPPVLLGGLAIGVFSSAVPFSLDMVALTRLPAKTFGVLTSLEPVVGALMGLVLLHQALAAAQWAGIAVIVIAAAGATASARRPA